jgi:lipase chaperone LimK
MPKRVRTGLTRSDILDRYIERFKQQLVKFQPFLSRKRGAASLEDFDEAAEELIGQVFGAASDEAIFLYENWGIGHPARRSPRKRSS